MRIIKLITVIVIAVSLFLPALAQAQGGPPNNMRDTLFTSNGCASKDHTLQEVRDICLGILEVVYPSIEPEDIVLTVTLCPAHPTPSVHGKKDPMTPNGYCLMIAWGGCAEDQVEFNCTVKLKPYVDGP